MSNRNSVIYKYNLTLDDLVLILLPAGAEVLTVQMQRGDICLWAMVNPENESTMRHFEIYGTGHLLPVDTGVSRKYIASIQDGVFVWHVFEREVITNEQE